MTAEVYTALMGYLKRLGEAEYKVFLARKKRKKSDRYNPSDYHRELVRLIGQDDEKGFKALKQLQGHASALGF